jgi:putative two-component system response regulator
VILVVDDDEQVRRALARILRSHEHDCRTAPSVQAARDGLADPDCELVLCDVMMPGESGFDLLRHVRAEHEDLPVIMVSGVSDLSFANLALELGAYGYVTKPFEPNQVLIEVAGALRRAELEVENASYRMHLEELVADRTAALSATIDELAGAEHQLRAASEEMVRSLSQAIEGRDIETGQHIMRMSRYTELLARCIGLDADRCEQIRLASSMHDVGKIAVADGILFKPGTLSPAEFGVIQEHAAVGYAILSKSELPLLQLAATIAWTHHERWDGHGYPVGLVDEDIPLEGRITAIADVFDALVSRRVYKAAIPLDRALEILREGRGTQFDPSLLDVFFDHIDDVEEIWRDYPDG